MCAVPPKLVVDPAAHKVRHAEDQKLHPGPRAAPDADVAQARLVISCGPYVGRYAAQPHDGVDEEEPEEDGGGGGEVMLAGGMLAADLGVGRTRHYGVVGLMEGESRNSSGRSGV